MDPQGYATRWPRLSWPKEKLIRQAPNPAQANLVEKCKRIREELESIAREVKIDLIRAIRRAQTAAKRRKNMDKAQGKIEPWALTHVANQGKKKARTADKKANRANPKGKRYLPKLDNQYESSVTYTSDSADSIPEVVWDSKRPQGPQKPQNPQPSTQNSDQMPGSARHLKRSIREKMKNQDSTKRNPSPQEGCTCPDGKCKWLGECLSPK